MMFGHNKHIIKFLDNGVFWMLVICFMPASQVFAQDKATAISQAADRYFEKEQFYKSAQYYQVALSTAPNDSYLNYQLAHSYREIFDYPMAEIYYQKAVDLDSKNYPLALFYHPLMQKANGKFDQAINNFNSFLTFAERNANISLQDRSRYVAQAVVEREGCVLALEQLSYPFRDYKFANATNTLNTKGNDYAPAMSTSDPSLITITSARAGTRGSLQDNRFGELFTDNFRYHLDGETWKPVRTTDQFEVTNTRFNDGAGSYDASGEKYYFTSCYGENAICQVYVSRKVGGKWQTPELLNDQVNMKDFDSKHPALSPGGDTLYFASNRPGGQGMMDIWMSKNSGGEQWEKPVNIGPKYNTPFNEVSPYFHPVEDIFFFSSSGHQGLGGLDVLMVQGFHDLQAEVRNIGPPFNSSYDDAFFVVNKEKGYLASNRPGGQGKFDIYQFNAEADESIMAELSEDGTVVDREALLRSRLRQYDKSALYAARDEDQFYYDNLTAEEKLQLERILNIKMKTEGSFDPKLTLSKEDFKFYRKLSIEDKARIERMAQLRAYQSAPGDEQEATITYWAGMDDQRQQDDALYYEELDADDKVIVDRIIAAKLEDKNTFSERQLEAEENKYFQSLTNEEKIRIARIAQTKEVNQKLEENLGVNAQSREYLSEQEQLEVKEYFDALSPRIKSKIESIISSQSKEEFDPSDLEAKELSYYSKLSREEKARLQRLAGMREVEQEIVEVAKNNQELRAMLSELDQPEDWLYYENLSPSDQDLTDQIVHAILRDRSSFKVRKLSTAEWHYFEGLSLNDQIKIDRIAQFTEEEKVNLAALNNGDSASHDKPKTRVGKLKFDTTEDKLYYKGLSKADQAMTDQIIATIMEDRTSFSSRKLSSEEENYFERLRIEDQIRINRIARFRQAQAAGGLQLESEQPADRDYYESLSPSDQAMTDQIIAVLITDRQTFTTRKLNSEQEDYFTNLSQEDQIRIDRLAQAKQMEQVYLASNITHEDSIQNVDQKGASVFKTSNDQEKDQTEPALLSEINRAEDLGYYSSLSSNDQTMTDQIIVSIMEDRTSFSSRKLSSEEENYFESLSLEDQIKINRIARFRQAQAAGGLQLESEQPADRDYYESLSPSDQAMTDQIIAVLITDRQTFTTRKLNSEQEDYFTNLSQEDQIRIDRLAQAKQMEQVYLASNITHEDSIQNVDQKGASVFKTSNDQEKDQTEPALLSEINRAEDLGYYSSLSSNDQTMTDQIIASIMEDRTSFSSRKLSSEEEYYFESLSAEDQIRINRIARFRQAQAGGLQLESEQPADRDYYESLSPSDQVMTDQIIAVLIADRESFNTRKLNSGQEYYFNNLSREDQIRIDRLAQVKQIELVLISSTIESSESQTSKHHQLASISGQLYDLENNKPAVAVAVPLVDGTNKIVFIDTTDSDGRFEFVEVLMNRPYKIMGEIPKPQLHQMPKYAVQDLAINTIDDNAQIALTRKGHEGIQDQSDTTLTENEIEPNQFEFSDGLGSLQELAVVNDSISSTYYPDRQLATISGQLYDLQNHGPAVNIAVSLLDPREQIVQVDTTDSDGRFEFLEIVLNRPYKIMGELPEPQFHQIPRYAVQDLAINTIDDGKVMPFSDQSTESIDEATNDHNAETILVSQVEELGTLSEGSIELFDNIYFEFDHSAISTDAETALNKLVKAYLQETNLTIEIHGHTDNIGPNDYNYQLSQKRGKSTSNYLIAKGVSADHIVVVAKGEAKPIASNASPSGRKLNRRVSFYVQQHPSDAVVRSVPGN